MAKTTLQGPLAESASASDPGPRLVSPSSARSSGGDFPAATLRFGEQVGHFRAIREPKIVWILCESTRFGSGGRAFFAFGWGGCAGSHIAELNRLLSQPA